MERIGIGIRPTCSIMMHPGADVFPPPRCKNAPLWMRVLADGDAPAPPAAVAPIIAAPFAAPFVVSSSTVSHTPKGDVLWQLVAHPAVPPVHVRNARGGSSAVTPPSAPSAVQHASSVTSSHPRAGGSSGGGLSMLFPLPPTPAHPVAPVDPCAGASRAFVKGRTPEWRSVAAPGLTSPEPRGWSLPIDSKGPTDDPQSKQLIKQAAVAVVAAASPLLPAVPSVVRDICNAAGPLVSAASKVFPPCAALFALVDCISELGRSAQCNRANCRFLRERVCALRPLLESISQQWSAVAAEGSPQAQARVRAVQPAFAAAEQALTTAKELLQHYASQSRVRRFFFAHDIQHDFAECDDRLSTCMAALHMGLSVQASADISSRLKQLQQCMPYIDSKLDALLEHMAHMERLQDSQLREMQRQFQVQQEDIQNAMCSIRRHHRIVEGAHKQQKQQQQQQHAQQQQQQPPAHQPAVSSPDGSTLEEAQMQLQALAAACKKEPTAGASPTRAVEPQGKAGSIKPKAALPSPAVVPSFSSEGQHPSQLQGPPPSAAAVAATSGLGGALVHISSSELHLGEVLGRGQFGVVRKATWRGLPVAVKMLLMQPQQQPSQQLQPSWCAPSAACPVANGLSGLSDEFWSELQMLAQLRCNRLLTIYGACVEPEHAFIVTEWMDGGSLFDCLHAKENEGGEPRVKIGSASASDSAAAAATASIARQLSSPFVLLDVSMQVAEGLLFLHSARPPIIHRDVKTSNVLLDRRLNVKLADFGLARSMQQQQEGQQQSQDAEGGGQHMPPKTRTLAAGTPAYMSPEILCCFDGSPPESSPADDLYSFGVLLWELWTGGALPWRGRSLAHIIAAHMAKRTLCDAEPQLTARIPPVIATIVRQLLGPAHQRQSAEQVLQSLKDAVAVL